MRSRLFKNLFISFFLLSGLGSQLATASDRVDDVASVSRETLRRGLIALPVSLDPHTSNNSTDRLVLSDLFTGLVQRDQNGEIAPGVAKSWEISDDLRTYTFRLRDDAVWQDGNRVTAGDFIQAFSRLKALGARARGALHFDQIAGFTDETDNPLQDGISGVSQVGDTTLVIRLTKPFHAFTSLLATPAAFPVPAHIYEIHGEDWVKPEHFIGNGAYILQSHERDNFIVLERNPAFYEKDQVLQTYVTYY